MDIPRAKASGETRNLRSRESIDEEEEQQDMSGRMSKLGLTAQSTREEQRVALLWALLASYLPEDVKSIEKYFVQHVEYTLARGRGNLTQRGAFKALAFHVRDRLIERFKDTQIYFREKNCKRVAYLSLEFLIGRSLQNAIVNLGLEDTFGQAMRNLGYILEDLYEEEQDAGLGNGGLGRLAACFLDSLASMDYPAWGYGLRYKYGMFFQRIVGGFQQEHPDYWLVHGNPREIERLDITYPVWFYGSCEEYEENGVKKNRWVNYHKVLAVAYDTPIPGYETYNTLNIRLWSAQPSREFDLETFNKGDFFKSIEEKQKSEQITAVLYPNDHTIEGKELRIKQQYLLVSATLQDIMRRFKQSGQPLAKFPDLIAIQLNDTHPTLGIPELLRLLIDFEGLEWAEAWGITTRTFGYTNHTVLPEALETWSVDLLGNLLPRHLKIIYEINHRFLELVEKTWPGDVEKKRRLSLIEEGPPRMIRMANLAIVGSHSVNGVAEIHSEILRDKTFPEFFQLWPNKFLNMTNGVTPRRWIQQATPFLAQLISSTLRTPNWITNLKLLQGLRGFAENSEFRRLWFQIKLQNKEKFAAFVEKKCGVKVSTKALFDVQVKRIHEYKRQLLNILYCIHRYLSIKSMTTEQKRKVVPRAVFFGGKAAPGYYQAKMIIKLINSVADVINNDPEIGDLLKVVFIANYCVSAAELIIPGAELSQHISTAGTEASGTSNMKFAMNGCLIIGTLDGANVEIAQEIGKENIFIFGAKANEISELRKKVSSGAIPFDPRFSAVLVEIEKGTFGDAKIFDSILKALKGGDYYLLSVDFPSYISAQEEVDRVYVKPEEWTRKSILSVAGSGKFSSDRTIQEYAEKIWNIKPVRRPGPVSISVERLSHVGIPSDLVSPGTSPNSAISLERMTPRSSTSFF